MSDIRLQTIKSREIGFDDDPVPKIGPLMVRGKIPDGARLKVNGPLFLNSHIGSGARISSDVWQGYETERDQLGAAYTEGLVQSGKIDAAGKRVGAHSELHAQKGMTLGSCGEGVKLRSRNGLIFIAGDVGAGAEVVCDYGDVFVQGRIGKNAIVKARNIACSSSVAQGASLEAINDVYVFSHLVSQKAKVSGCLYSPRGWRKHLPLKNYLGPIHGALHEESVSMDHPEGQPPKGWTEVVASEHISAQRGK